MRVVQVDDEEGRPCVTVKDQSKRWRKVCVAMYQRYMQREERGRRPMRVVQVDDEEGRPCVTVKDQSKRWRRHFRKVLNTESQLIESELDQVKQRPCDESIGGLPDKREVKRPLGKLKNGKAPGCSCILSEIVRVGKDNEDFVGMLQDVLTSVWEERKVQKEWTNAGIIPIPKKGNLSSSNNWRGIALLEVVRKVARVIQGRLQRLVERELPDSQCGYRKSRSCTDMTFVVRQLREKAQEHRLKLFTIFMT